MIVKEKEIAAIKDLQTQEQNCIEKYGRSAQNANDPVLQELFKQLQKDEKQHYESLSQVLQGATPSCDCNDDKGAKYNPQATYDSNSETEEKKQDCFLATDCIATEKLVSSEYNSDVFIFSDTEVRKLLADIQIEEQNHAEMLFKYKTVNGMS